MKLCVGLMKLEAVTSVIQVNCSFDLDFQLELRLLWLLSSCRSNFLLLFIVVMMHLHVQLIMKSCCDAVVKQTNRTEETRDDRDVPTSKHLAAPTPPQTESPGPGGGGGGAEVPVAGPWVSAQAQVEDRGGRLEVTPAGQSQRMTDGGARGQGNRSHDVLVQ